MSEADFGGMAIEMEPSQPIFHYFFIAVRQMATEGQSDTKASDTEVQMKQKCIFELFHTEKKR